LNNNQQLFLDASKRIRPSDPRFRKAKVSGNELNRATPVCLFITIVLQRVHGNNLKTHFPALQNCNETR